jgi:hypothetical protein
VPRRLLRLTANRRPRIYERLRSCKPGKIAASSQCPPFQLIGINHGSFRPDCQISFPLRAPRVLFDQTMKKILVVADDPAVQRVLKRTFEPEGFAVELTSDGKFAIDALRPALPSAVILEASGETGT